MAFSPPCNWNAWRGEGHGRTGTTIDGQNRGAGNEDKAARLDICAARLRQVPALAENGAPRYRRWILPCNER